MPKSVTFARTGRGRIHGRILRLNEGYVKSVLLKHDALGAAMIRGTSVTKFLTRTQARLDKLKSTQYKINARLGRFRLRQRRYKVHEEIHYSKGMTDICVNLPSMRELNDHQYALQYSNELKNC